MNTLNLQSIKFNTESYKKTSLVYHESFPKIERLPLWFLTLRSSKKNIDFLGIYDGEDYIGFSYVVSKDDLTYVLYLAIEPEAQGKGYGSSTLQALRDYFSNNRIILNIEKPDEASPNQKQRLKRRKFYLKNGYTPVGIHTVELGEDYEMLGYGKHKVTKSDYLTLLKSFVSPIFYPFLKRSIKFKS